MARTNILSVCPVCGGDGVNKGITCGLCDGTGKVIDRELDISALETQLDALQNNLDQVAGIAIETLEVCNKVLEIVSKE